MDIKLLRRKMKTKFQNVKWSGGHPCGYGSRFGNTKVIRELLPKIVKKYNIHSISDAGAGNLSWIEKIEWPYEIEYVAYDIYPRHPNVIEFDITSQTLPPRDLILCRHVLNHLTPILRTEAIKKLQESGSKYILCTVDNTKKNLYWGEPIIPFVKEDMNSKRQWYYGLWKIV